MIVDASLFEAPNILANRTCKQPEGGGQRGGFERQEVEEHKATQLGILLARSATEAFNDDGDVQFKLRGASLQGVSGGVQPGATAFER